MSCDNSTYCIAIELMPCTSLTIEAGNYGPGKTDLEPEQSQEQGRVPLTAKTESQGRRREARSRFIPDSTETDPEYVWGDEGPIND